MPWCALEVILTFPKGSAAPSADVVASPTMAVDWILAVVVRWLGTEGGKLSKDFKVERRRCQAVSGQARFWQARTTYLVYHPTIFYVFLILFVLLLCLR